jgi:hypothetical protein
MKAMLARKPLCGARSALQAARCGKVSTWCSNASAPSNDPARRVLANGVSYFECKPLIFNVWNLARFTASGLTVPKRETS